MDLIFFKSLKIWNIIFVSLVATIILCSIHLTQFIWTTFLVAGAVVCICRTRGVVQTGWPLCYLLPIPWSDWSPGRAQRSLYPAAPWLWPLCYLLPIPWSDWSPGRAQRSLYPAAPWLAPAHWVHLCTIITFQPNILNYDLDHVDLVRIKKQEGNWN